MKDLTVSAIDRQNILNNTKAVENIQTYLGITGMLFQGEYKFTRQQITDFYAIDNSHYFLFCEDTTQGVGPNLLRRA